MYVGPVDRLQTTLVLFNGYRSTTSARWILFMNMLKKLENSRCIYLTSERLEHGRSRLCSQSDIYDYVSFGDEELIDT